ncbi:MAG: uracil-DNA glycosylase family protein [Microlunatus sp.]|nr:uracil-DNA glycosylase family protein [Microlunatus sp.]
MSSFEALRAAVAADAENAAATRAGYRPLFVASERACVLLIGQAPGLKAQETGIPFNDASGRILCGWLGVDDSEFRDPDLFAILPMDFYYPGKGPSGDLPPRRGFAARWHPPILELLPNIRLTVLIGAYAQRHYLGPRARRSVTETVRSFQEYLPDTIPVVHPSPINFRWHSRNPWFMTDLVPVLQQRVRDVAGRADPGDVIN